MPDRPTVQLLEALAAALNACQSAGLKPKLRSGAVFTKAGWVLPPVGGAGAWVARFPSGPAEDDLEPPDPDDLED